MRNRPETCRVEIKMPNKTHQTFIEGKHYHPVWCNKGKQGGEKVESAEPFWGEGIENGKNNNGEVNGEGLPYQEDSGTPSIKCGEQMGEREDGLSIEVSVYNRDLLRRSSPSKRNSP